MLSNSMHLQEWYSIGMRRAVEQKIVSQIRSSYKKYDADIIADMLNVTKNDLAETVQIISEHPDWDDEKVADAVDWDRK